MFVDPCLAANRIQVSTLVDALLSLLNTAQTVNSVSIVNRTK